MTEVSKLT